MPVPFSRDYDRRQERERVTEEVRRRASLLDVAREASPKLRRSGREWRGPCPIHQGDGPNFSLNPGTGVWHCHVCGAGGDVFEFVMRWRGVGFAEARAFLAARTGVTLEEEIVRPVGAPAGRAATSPAPVLRRPAPPVPLIAEPARRVWSARTAEDRDDAALAWRQRLADEGASGWAEPSTIYTALREALPLSDKARAYLGGRGIDPDAAFALGVRSVDDWSALPGVLAGLGFDPWECVAAGFHVAPEYRLPDGRTEARPRRTSPAYVEQNLPALLFTYIGRGGRVVSVRLRTIAGEAQLGAAGLDAARWRYLSLRGNGPRLPWGADALAGLAGEVLHVAEGEPDALSLRMHGARSVGIPGASAVPGGVDAPWLRSAGAARRILLWYDPDEGGDRGAPRLRDALRAANGWSADEARRRVRRVRIDGAGPSKTDVNDLHLRGQLPELLASLLKADDA